jgi:hypothetical protein
MRRRSARLARTRIERSRMHEKRSPLESRPHGGRRSLRDSPFMKGVLRSRFGLRFSVAVLALLFVFPPEAMARMSCATLAMLSLPMPCCVTHPADAVSNTKSCCCAADSEQGSRIASANAEQSKVRAPEGCSCAKNAGRDASTPPARDAGSIDLCAWVSERAQVSARALHFDCLATHIRAQSDHDGPTLASSCPGGGAGSSPPAVGCARHDLLARGVIGLLTDFGTALL